MKTNGTSVLGSRWARVAATMVSAATTMVSAATLALSGCYLFSPSQASVDKLQTQLHFDISQCQQTAPNLYKCPGVDRSICGALYAGQLVDCVALDKDGNVIVMKE
jgi:hypothetical protein